MINRMGKQKQQGVVMMVSLIMLIVIGILTLSLMGMSRTELRMAHNDEVRAGALQLAQAATDLIVASPGMTPVIGTAGYKFCTDGVADCDDYDEIVIVEPGLEDEVDDGHLEVEITRGDPEYRPPPRGMGFSASKFTATTFEVAATYDRAEDGLGYAEINEGLIVLIPLQ